MALFDSEVPECTIDFDRKFCLPFGVPPALPAGGLVSYFAGLALGVGIVRYPWNDDGTPFGRNPEHARKLKTRTLPLAAGAHTLLPRSTTPAPAVDAKTAVVDLTKAAVKDLDKMSFRWENPASGNTGSLAMPVITDESLALHWPPAPVGAAILTAPLAGVLANDAAQYLLDTPVAGRDGELDRTVLRAPARALVRFDRYRHVTRTAAGTLEESYPSAAGALIVRKLVTDLAPREPDSALERERVLIFENVDVAASQEFLARLVWLQVLRLDALLARSDRKGFDAALLGQMNFLLKSWLAYLLLNPPAAALAGIADTLLDPFRADKPAVEAQVKTLVTAVIAAPAAKQGLLSFIQTRYVQIICGQSWAELGVVLPAEAGLTTVQKKARSVLINLSKSKDTWLYCYAGCPLGKPSKIYMDAPGAPPLPAALIESALTTFELEGVVIAGESANQFAGIVPAALPANISQPLNISAFDPKAAGAFSVFRAVDLMEDKQEYTSVDWLSELVMGAHRDAELGAKIDFAEYATGGHPLAAALDWPTYRSAVLARIALDTLRTTTVASGATMEGAIVAWWNVRSGLTKLPGGTWPFQPPFGLEKEVPIGPKDPYLPGETPDREKTTAGDPTVAGLDVFDLLAAYRARAVVLDGKDPTNAVDLAVILALMEREGYRAGGFIDRVGGHPSRTRGWVVLPWKVILAGGATRDIVETDIVGDRQFDGIARAHWIVFPFGLDLANDPLDLNTSTHVFNDSRNAFVNFYKRALAAGSLTPTPSASTAHAYAVNRLNGFAFPPTGVVKDQRASRQLQWLGIACQQAEFQRRHNVLFNNTGGTEVDKHWRLTGPGTGTVLEVVDEFTSPALPPVGASADSVERRDFIAYYALLYLAFNVHPATWNKWVQVAKANIGAGGKVSRFLTYYTNVVVRAIEPDPPAAGVADPRALGHRANMLRFSIALDAYLRMSLDPAELTDPATGRGAW